jgi:hypothetical protein
MIGTRHRLESIYWGPWYNHEDPGWIIRFNMMMRSGSENAERI